MKTFLLALLRVPPEPQPPAGLTASVRVFRASRNFYRLNLLKWGLGQIGALIGVISYFALDLKVQYGPHFQSLFGIIELIGMAGWVVQLPFTFLLIRFDYEMRWYIVTDRSLRIRHGLIQVREMTMTFANIQQLTIHQGPLQRLLGISDLRVRTAGGGADESDGSGARPSTHLGYFRGVDHAETIRDLIVERLRKYRDAGLGDPDDLAGGDGRAIRSDNGQLTAAARELLGEVRGLRASLESLNA